jgi:hypothetical protein
MGTTTTTNNYILLQLQFGNCCKMPWVAKSTLNAQKTIPHYYGFHLIQ